MTPTQIIEDFLAAGGRIAYRPPDVLSVDFPPAAGPLLPLLREHKPAILAALRHAPDGPCPAGHPAYWWRTVPGGPWACGRCQPDPRATRWRGVTLATLGNRRITLTAPAADLPQPGEWVQTPAGAADLLCWRDDGAEALVRLFDPRPGQLELLWCGAGHIQSELARSRPRQP